MVAFVASVCCVVYMLATTAVYVVALYTLILWLLGYADVEVELEEENIGGPDDDFFDNKATGPKLHTPDDEVIK